RTSAACWGATRTSGVAGTGRPASRRLEPQERSVAFVEQVEQSVGAGAHVADAADDALQQALLAHQALALETQAHEHAAAQGADEEVALPFREALARVERHPGRRDGGNPFVERLF